MRTIDDDLNGAAMNGSIELVRLLLDHGADGGVNSSQSIRWAAENGHIEIVKLLIDNGVDFTVWDNYPIRWASRYGHTEVVQLLKEATSNKDLYDEIVKIIKHENL